DKLETAVNGSGSTRHVVVKAFAVSGKTSAGAFSVAYDGSCTTFTLPGDAKATKTCCADAQGQLDKLGLGALSSLATLDKTLGFTVVEVDGHWYVSPTRTTVEIFVGMLRPLDQKKLHDIITSLQDMGKTRLGNFQTVGGAIDSSANTPPASTNPPAYVRCYAAGDPKACFADAVASGEITATDVPVEFRFDCFGTYYNDRANMSL